MYKEDTMDFIDQIRAIAAKAKEHGEYLQTEEATKQALVLPFIQALGFDIFNTTEVVPEFTADVGTKKGEKVDYTILKDGKPIILIECKKYGCDLSKERSAQLYRYFSVTNAKIAVLTNGACYRFFTDLEEPNKMDEKPFMEFDLLDINESLVAELKKLTKPTFDLDAILTVAGELKYTREIKRILGEQMTSPSPDFVRFFAAQVYPRTKTQKVMEQFKEVMRRAFVEFINERMKGILQSAITSEGSGESAQPKEEASEELGTVDGQHIVTTPEEIEAFYIVKSILRQTVEPSRIHYRDTVNYFGVLLDNTNRKPICRLYFNSPKRKYIGLFDSNKKETKTQIQTLDDVYALSEKLKETVVFYDRSESGGASAL